jgi:hypothetical protein
LRPFFDVPSEILIGLPSDCALLPRFADGYNGEGKDGQNEIFVCPGEKEL